MLDIETLRVIWWCLLGVLLIGFAMTDGFDFGAAILLPLVTRNEAERQIVLDAIGAIWEGNQVWIILGAGAIFAAWPLVYAVTFSTAYFAVLLLLLTMGISRPVSFKYRSKLPNDAWRRFWDRVVFTGGLVPAFLFGVLMGNTLQGLPFYFDNSLRIFSDATLLGLLNPFAVLCGLTSIAMLVMHGGLFLAIKTNDPIRERAMRGSRVGAACLIALFAMAGVWVVYGLTGYQLLSPPASQGYSNPLHKAVIPVVGAWTRNYTLYPWTQCVPAIGFIGALGAFITARVGNSRFAFFCSSLSLSGVIGTVGVSMFPFILPSSTNASSSLLVWDASSSQLTLLVMLAAAIIFLPIIVAYTSWVYYILRGKVR